MIFFLVSLFFLSVSSAKIEQQEIEDNHINGKNISLSKNQEKEKADKLFLEGEEFFKKGEIDKAIEKWIEALNLYRAESDKKSQVITIENIGNAFDEAGNYNRAIECYQQGLELLKTLDDKVWTGVFHTNVGSSYWGKGNFQKALENYMVALEIDRELKDRSGEAGDLSNIGSTYYKLKAYDKSLENYMQAVERYKMIGDKRKASEFLCLIGDIYLETGEGFKAQEEYLSALGISNEIKDKDSVNDIIARIEKSKKVINKITVSEEKEKKEKVDESLDVLENSTGRGKERAKKIAGDAENLIKDADLFSKRKNYKKAALAYTEALEKLRDSGNSGRLADLCFKIAEAYFMCEDRDNSIAYCNQVLTFKKQMGNKKEEADGLILLGNIFRHFNDYDEALKRYDEASKIESGTRDNSGLAVSLINTGDTYRFSGIYNKAGEAYLEGLRVAIKISDSEFIWRAYYGLAFVSEKANNTEQALRYYMQAIDTVNEKKNIKSENRIRVFESDEGVLFDDIKKILFRLHGKDKKRGYDKLAYFYNEMSESLRFKKGLFNSEVLLKEKTDDLFLQYKAFTVYQAQRKLLKNTGEILLKYCVEKDATYLFVISRESLNTVKISLSEDDLADMVLRLRSPFDKLQEIRDMTSFYKILEDLDLKTANKLYLELIRPAWQYIKEARVLLIAPSGVLRYLPFEMLVKSIGERQKTEGVIFSDFSDSTYLADEFFVSYIPMMSSFSEFKKDSGNEHKEFDGSILSIGDFDIFRDEQNQASDNRFKVINEPKINKSNFKDFVQRFSIINVSSPALIDDSKPLQSGIFFKGEKDGENLLTFFELYNLKLNPSLFIINNCEYDLTSSSGEGMEIMTGSLIESGLSGVILNLWKSDDESKRNYLKELFNYLGETNSADNFTEAVNLSKRKIKKSSGELNSSPHKVSFSHPYFWAGFVVLRGN